MIMIPQKSTEIQNILNKTMNRLPVVLAGDGRSAYILIRTLSDEMERYLETGQTDDAELAELHVFSKKYEQALIRHWGGYGFECEYRSQAIEYMHHPVMVTYIQVRNPKTGLRISLIPWFLLPGRLYPVFVYMYAIWHYNITGQESQAVSAAVTGKVFGVESFNKSTLCRNKKALGQLLGKIEIDKPLQTAETEASSTEVSISSITEILQTCMSMEMLEEACGFKVGHMPAPINRSETVGQVLSRIDPGLSKATKGRNATVKSTSDNRIRAAGRRGERRKYKGRKPVFVDSRQIRQIRLSFIAQCRGAVMDAAATYHKFLI